MDNETFIKNAALAVGFDACGIAATDFLPKDAAYLQQWLADGCHGEMHYMANHFGKRTDPRLLVENAKSIVVVLMNYFPQCLQPSGAPLVAKYAYGADYHFVVKNKLNELLVQIQQRIPCEGIAFCDSAPILERRWAQRAGLGWIGKSNLFIHPTLGSYCFIGELLLDIALKSDEPMAERCGQCRKCLDACPTNALSHPYRLDARRCISYLTIEYRGKMEDICNEMLENHLFGCDVCLDACPWNAKAKANFHAELQPQEAFFQLDWSRFTRGQFNNLFKNSPLRRAGYRKLKDRLNAIYGTSTITQ